MVRGLRSIAAATLLAGLFPLVGCGGGTGRSAQGVQAEVTAEPLGIALSFRDQALTTLVAGQRSALYLVDADGQRTYLARTARRDGGGAVERWHLETEDGRPALLDIEPMEDQALRLTFQVEGKRADEQLGATFSVAADEAFYGLMERVVQGGQDQSWRPGMTAGLDLRGQEVWLFVMYTVSLYSPFYLSSAGYGVYVESDWPGTYRFGTDDPEVVEIEYEGPALTMRILPGPSLLEVSQRYARATGLSLLPPRWVFGPWRWRNEVWDLPAFYEGTPYDGPYNSMLVEDVLMMEALGIPCSLYWIDRPWCPGFFGYDDLAWDLERLPQPRAMIDWLSSKGIRLMLWIAPWADGQMADEAFERGYEVAGAMPTHPFDARLIDLTNPDAVAWWQTALAERIAEGVVGFKLDRGEEKVPDGEVFQGSYHDGRSFRELHNAYPRLYAQAVAGAFERAGVDQFAVMPRSGWRGSSQYAVFWGGDTKSDEWGLRSAIIAVQRAAVMNFPVWGSDTCGYGLASHEVCARWLAFSAFCPLMEVGPTGNLAPWSGVPDGESGGVGPDGYRHEPFYDEQLIAIWHLYANLHADLQEYLHAQARAAHELGTPIVRPMAFLVPDDPEVRDRFDQYLLGPDLLVAPIWQTGVASRSVWLPEGRWRDAWTGAEHAGQLEVEVDAPVHRIPIFIRADSGLDLGDLDARWQAARAAAAQVPDLAALASTVR